MTTFNNRIEVKNLGFQQVATIFVPKYQDWANQVNNDKGFRISINFPVNEGGTTLFSPKKLRLTVSTCRGFVDLNSDSSSITINAADGDSAIGGGTIECMFSIESSSPYVSLDPNVDHFINVKLLEPQSGTSQANFYVDFSFFDIGGETGTCTNGEVTPGFAFQILKSPDRKQIIQNFILDFTASLTIPPRTSSDWGTEKPTKFSINLSHDSELPAPRRWEMIVSECPGSFEEALPASVGRPADYHLISSESSGSIDVVYKGIGPNPPPGPLPDPPLNCAGKGNPTHIATGTQTFFNNVYRRNIISLELPVSFLGGKPGATGTILGLSPAGETADVQAVVSTCPNDFTSYGPECSFISRGSQGGYEFLLSDKPVFDNGRKICTLPKNTQKYYVNIRQVLTPANVQDRPPYNAPFCPTDAPGQTGCWLPSCPPGENCNFDLNQSASDLDITPTTPPTKYYARLDSSKKSANVSLSGDGLTVYNSTLNLNEVDIFPGFVLSSIGKSSGKWYFEVTTKNTINYMINPSRPNERSPRDTFVLITETSPLYKNILSEKTIGVESWRYNLDGSTFSWSDISSQPKSSNDSDLPVLGLKQTIGFALDMDNKTLTMYKTNIPVGPQGKVLFNDLKGKIYVGLSPWAEQFMKNPPVPYPGVNLTWSGEHGISINFGQNPFVFSVPAGFNAGFYD